MKGVVIGYDHRRMESLQLSSIGFARISAAVLLSQGFKVQEDYCSILIIIAYQFSIIFSFYYAWKVFLFERFVPTPFVAFAVTQLNCVGNQCLHVYFNVFVNIQLSLLLLLIILNGVII